ncbi:MAG TPA: flagellar export chaperone FlgN [Tepidisphaeraceae bacterium]|nr:flagellar export chaperone FlgN [Tepidisphaeraceae bacterium]
MSRQAQDLEVLLDQMVVEHRKLLQYVDLHHAAMKEMNLGAMEQARAQQEACRLRIKGIDSRRKNIAQQLMKLHKFTAEPTLSQIAVLYPPSAQGLLSKRDSLRRIAGELALRTNVSSKLAGAVLGHLNTAVKFIASAVQNAGVYTKTGVHRVAPRIGALEAVG